MEPWAEELWEALGIAMEKAIDELLRDNTSSSGTVFHCNLMTSKTAGKPFYEMVLSCPSFDHQAGDTVSIPFQKSELLSRTESDYVLNSGCCLAIFTDTKKVKAELHIWLFIAYTSTLEIMFDHMLDIRAVSKKSLMGSLLEDTRGDVDIRKLAMFSSNEGGQEYMTKIGDSQITLMESLAIVHSCVPLVLKEHLPRLNLCPYSLSSSTMATPSIQVTKSRPGLASTWMSKLQPRTMDKLLRDNEKVLFNYNSKGLQTLLVRSSYLVLALSICSACATCISGVFYRLVLVDVCMSC